MTVKSVRDMVNAITKAGIKRFTIWCNNAYIVDVDGESTKVIFDDANARFFYLRIPNNVSPYNNTPLSIECEEYELIERICANSTQDKIMEVFNNLGLKQTDDITQWLKTAGSQSGLYLEQTDSRDEKGNLKAHKPFVPYVK